MILPKGNVSLVSVSCLSSLVDQFLCVSKLLRFLLVAQNVELTSLFMKLFLKNLT